MNGKAQFARFCAEEPQVPIFMQPWYLDATAGSDGWGVAIKLIHGNVVGVWPYVLKQRWLWTSVTMPPFLRFCGPLVGAQIVQEAQRELVIADLESQLPHVSLFSQDLPFESPLSLLFKFGFRSSERLTYVLENIHRQDKVYAGIHADYRKNKLPKGEKVYESTSEVNVDTFLSMHRDVYSRQNLQLPAEDAYFLRLDAALQMHGARAILGARNKETGKIDAVAYLVAWKDTCYLLASADVVKSRKQASSIFILWQSIRYAYNHFGATRFDFLGSMVPSIASVRKQFGAQPVSYQRIERESGVGKVVKLVRRYASKSIGK